MNECNSWTHYPPSGVSPVQIPRRSIGHHSTDCARLTIPYTHAPYINAHVLTSPPSVPLKSRKTPARDDSRAHTFKRSRRERVDFPQIVVCCASSFQRRLAQQPRCLRYTSLVTVLSFLNAIFKIAQRPAAVVLFSRSDKRAWSMDGHGREMYRKFDGASRATLFVCFLVCYGFDSRPCATSLLWQVSRFSSKVRRLRKNLPFSESEKSWA